jgi:endonuclease/exonuclease/phosphatase family metal-dependent hydrolase
MKTTKTEGDVGNAKPNRWPNLARRTALFCIVAAIAGQVMPLRAGNSDLGGKKHIKFYDANAYVGADLAAALTVDPSDINAVVAAATQIYGEILASRPDLRLVALAREIATAQPDIAALEELYTLQKAPLTATSPEDFTTIVDFLQVLTNALAAQGAHYQVAVLSTESDVSLPMLDLPDTSVVLGRLTDHEVILVRTDLPPGHLRVTNPETGHFSTYLQIPAAGLNILRGWCSVDVFTRGERFRFICAHLEEETAPPIQMAQAQELLAGPANVSMPVVIAGDMNADPLHRTGTTTYDLFGQAGFLDAWAALNPGDPAGGLTWGHDALLADPTEAFIWRLDYLFYRGAQLFPSEVQVIDLALNRSQPPLWATDHATLAASFLLGNPKALSSKATLQAR